MLNYSLALVCVAAAPVCCGFQRPAHQFNWR